MVRKLFIISYSLQHGLGLDGWVIGAEVLVLVDIFLEGEQLLLQLVAEAGQRVADVVGQLLVEHALQVRGAQPVRDVSVRWVAGKL